MISTGVFGLIDDDARLAVSVVEAVLVVTLLAPADVVVALESNEGVDAEVDSRARARRIDELLDASPASDEVVMEELSNSSVFLINRG